MRVCSANVPRTIMENIEPSFFEEDIMHRLAVLLFVLLAAACSLDNSQNPVASDVTQAPTPTNLTLTSDKGKGDSRQGNTVTIVPVGTPVPVGTAVPTVAITAIPATVPAQGASVPSVDPNVRGVALTSSGDVGEIALTGDALYVAYNPIDPTHYARIDHFGILHYAPLNTPEGVYSFAPSFDGFSAPSLQENKLRMVETQWSPNGQMLAFHVASGDSAANDGIWFWQPARDMGTDPSYHLLRDCPPGCDMVTRVNAEQWHSLSFDWSSDNQAILVRLDLPLEKRHGLAIVQAVRDPATSQSRTGPNVLRYDYGHWTSDGQRVVVSGAGTDGRVVFGVVGRDGGNAVLTAASSVGLAWVQDAVEQPGTGQIVMLGSTAGAGSALRLYDASGKALSEAIGSGAPSQVSWSPDRSAVLVVVGDDSAARYYLAHVSGGVTDITNPIGSTRAVNWVPTMPKGAKLMTPAIPTGVVEGSSYSAGQQLRVVSDQLDVYDQPKLSGGILGVVKRASYVAILAGPVNDGAIIWWRVQTASGLVGWIGGQINGVVTLAP